MEHNREAYASRSPETLTRHGPTKSLTFEEVRPTLKRNKLTGNLFSARRLGLAKMVWGCSSRVDLTPAESFVMSSKGNGEKTLMKRTSLWRAVARRLSLRRRGRRLLLEPLEGRWLLATLFVNSTADQTDINPGNGICETQAGNGICTLCAAIIEANALANVGGPDEIHFNVPGDMSLATCTFGTTCCQCR